MISQQWHNHDIYRKSLELDNWQTVDENISYVYSAHLDPESNEGESVVQILGALRDRVFEDKNSAYRQNVQCKLWRWSPGNKEPTVTITRVEKIILHYNIRG